MNRKQFLTTSLLFGGASMLNAPKAMAEENQKNSDPLILSDIPNYCCHEHWGSIIPISSEAKGFLADRKPGAIPSRTTTLLDILIDPYMLTNYWGIGVNPLEFKKDNRTINILEMATDQPVKAFRLLEESLSNFYMRGTYRCQRMGVHFAYGIDFHIAGEERLKELNAEIGNNYSSLFNWYQKLMKKANLKGLIRPVEPEFYFAKPDTPAAARELSFTRTNLRIDPFFAMWDKENQRRDFFVDKIGVDPVDAASWRQFLESMFLTVKKAGCIGIKQFQAYFRSLDYDFISDDEVKFRGDLSEGEVTKFQNWIMHECSRMANDMKWSQQIHSGTHNLPHSNPLPLEKIARRYPDQDIILLHCWPFIKEAGYLAQYYPNVYLDACWQQNLNPDFLRESLNTWLGYIPRNKLMISNDSTTIEMAVGSSIITRNILAEALKMKKENARLSDKEMMNYARSILYGNAAGIFGEA